ncbi:AmmeMemoRadiSam system radical SAM enzyme [Halanaerobacter jeridensis]|uniref:Pyruvate formate lyase activating enzyme n=1 Tax=Halanaerobacter jeridensis TaxID=706427 RepID=A0A938XYF6_9FIRM|nr:AmmeMemoRadiSam system radical SAM enzyme [Halanaerobacter jeridensis]MBM7557987.1 pyruvate formate lyase activating enzyme [Halanaerobacter jeridensis]
MQKADYYTHEDGKIKCLLCPHYCKLNEGQTGLCQVRKVKDNKLWAASYAQVSSVALDPIEKKPLYEYHPHNQILSLGSIGCNLSCQFCQNYRIAQEIDVPTRKLSPQEAVELAQDKGSFGIAYTYSEPLVWYEYVRDTAQLAQQQGLKNVLVTNGTINPKPLKELLPYIDAVNLDIKAFTEEFYRDVCGGDFATAKQSAEIINASDTHLELTTLIIPNLNDEPGEIQELVDWIADLDPEIPLHLSRYFPHYKLDKPPTPKETLYQAQEIAEEKLTNVYLGNV